MNITINRESNTPVYIQIVNIIRDMILSGQLAAGQPLPPERKLADQLDVNRSTVLKAYQELKTDGLLGSHVGRGTVVLPQVFDPHKQAFDTVYPVQWDQLFNKNIIGLDDNIVSSIMKVTSREGVISFAGGMPAADVYPVEEFLDIQSLLSRETVAKLMSHSPVEGFLPFRESLSGHMEQRGIKITSKDIMVLSGSQQGLDFTARCLLCPGDIVVVEEPTYMGALNVFKASGARILGIPVDKEGMRVDMLDGLLKRYKPKLIYTLPTFQNPSGTVMSPERRHQLLELSYMHQVPILEDDPYGELRYEGTAIPPIKALDRHGYVIYLSTFSKVFFMGMRVGWVAAPKQIIEKFSVLKQITDLQVNTPAQYLFNEFLRGTLYRGHLARVIQEYTLRRDCMISELLKYSSLNINWNKPEGGYYLWCSLPRSTSQEALFSEAKKQGVAYVPGISFYPNGEQGSSHMRLNFTFAAPARIKEGIRRLAKSIELATGASAFRREQAEYGAGPIV